MRSQRRRNAGTVSPKTDQKNLWDDEESGSMRGELMTDDIVIDPKNADAAAILRDLAEAKGCDARRSNYKIMLLKGALEQLMTLECRGGTLSPSAVAHLRASVIRELQTL